MTHAYDEQYLSDAMNNLGEMMDYAVNTCPVSYTHLDVYKRQECTSHSKPGNRRRTHTLEFPCSLKVLLYL